MHPCFLAVQDIVERFQLLLVLCFVVVEDISNSGTWWPATGTLLECGRIFLWEVGIDPAGKQTSWHLNPSPECRVRERGPRS